MNKSIYYIIHFFALYLIGCTFLGYSQQKIIQEGDAWLYYDNNVPPSVNWMTSTTSSENWKTGISPLGYGDDIIKTDVGFGDNPNKKHITKYFKKSFRLENPHAFLMYKLNIQRDDGVVIYLNGYEIWRNNMPQGKIEDNTVASNLVFNNELEKLVITKILPADEFVYGINTLSASVHQARAASSDCLFNLELIGSNDSGLLPLLLKERSIKNIELNAKVKDLNYKLEIEKKDLQLQFELQTKNNYKTFLYVIGLAFLVSVVSIIIGILYFKKKESQLSQNLEDLKDLINSKDQEMISISLNSLNSQQHLRELKKDLEKSSSGDGISIKKNFSKIISQLESLLKQDDDWDSLKKHFNAVHTGFFDKLLQQHPTLTETELRHCVFIKLHMHTKEIAFILHIDPRSVQASRYRIKKKMNLDESVDLKLYLQNI